MRISNLFILIFYTVLLSAQDSLIGVVKPIHNIQLSLATDGIVDKVFVKEGSIVRQGDALIMLDNVLQRLEMQRRELIYKDDSKLNSTLQEEKILSSLYTSTKELYQKTGGVSKAELQSVKIKYLTSLGESKSLQESKKKEKIEYQIARKLLDQYTLYSPINGIVTKLNIDLGEFVKNTEPIISIVDSSICFVEMNLDKELVSRIKKNQVVSISSGRSENRVSKQATIVYISPIADRSSGLFFVKAEFENKKLDILPGLTVEVRLDN